MGGFQLEEEVLPLILVEIAIIIFQLVEPKLWQQFLLISLLIRQG